jgi:hypothetical protein
MCSITILREAVFAFLRVSGTIIIGEAHDLNKVTNGRKNNLMIEG